MSKPVLGRGLGNLMEGSKVVGQTDPAAASPTEFSHGLGNFLRRDTVSNGDASADSAHSLSPVARRRLRWSLIAADALLAVLVVWLLWAKPIALGWVGTVLCLAAVALGAWLAWLAFSFSNEESGS